jgi:hypothetical protein
MVVLRTDKRSYNPGNTVTVTVSSSHFGPQPLDQGRITWKVEGTSLAGTLLLPSLPAASASPAFKIQFVAPPAAATSKKQLDVEMVLEGKTLAKNSLTIYVYPDRQPDLAPPVSYYDPTGKLRRLVNAMRRRNYLASSGSEAVPVVITSTLDAEVKKKLESGARVLLLSSEGQTLAPGIDIVPRAGTDYEGNWISNFLWLRTNQPPFQALGFDAMVGFEAQAINAPAVIRGIAAKDFRDVWAGMFYGWIHSSVGVLVEAKCGKGTLLICTLSLDTTYGTDPYATELLDALVNYLVSGAPPKLQIPL